MSSSGLMQYPALAQELALAGSVPEHVVIGAHSVRTDHKWLAPCLSRQAEQTTARRANIA